MDPFLEKVVENLVPYRGVEKYGINGDIYQYGIWKSLTHFSQACQGNCSFAHVKSALLVNSTKTIPQGTPLTIDFACYMEPLDRKEYLSSRYEIFCSCKVCEWKEWPKDMGSWD